jgi:hypothetical protein
MALILNSQHDDYDSERMRTFESFAVNSQSDKLTGLDEERENILTDSIRRDRSSVVTDRDQVEANDDILNTDSHSI